MSLLYLLIGIICLFFTQRVLGKQISRLMHGLGGGKNSVIWIWSVVFMPGTLLHEVSHFIMAAATGTHTGKIEIFPEFIEDEMSPGESRSVKLGSVQVARMNPVQGFLVGLAPLITGSLILLWLSTLLIPTFTSGEYLKFSVIAYAFFAIANSFFPSKEDLRHTIPFVVLLILIIIGAWYLGLKVNISPNSKISELSGALSTAFFMSFGINVLIIGILYLINKSLNRSHGG